VSALLDGSYRFEGFVVGASNRLAASAARAVADAPGSAYNPLFVYGGSGLGKTHLVAAIAHEARQQRPALRIEFTTGEEVAERLHVAIASGQPQRVAEHYQLVDLLILDDMQFLTGQRETQSELLRLFNMLQGSGRQLVLTSDRQPSEIPDVDQRLLSRLSGGLVVDVGAPDFEMRLAILRNVSLARGFEAAAGVLDEVARLAFGNVRELKGALNKLSAYQQLEGQPVAAADVRAILGERPLTTPPARIAAIIPEGTTEYDGFLADVLLEVETRVEPWRVQVGEAIDSWRQAGYLTGVLERALGFQAAPDVQGLLQTFAAAVEHLRGLEDDAAALDPTYRGHRVFRNVEGIAEALVVRDQLRRTALPLPAPAPAYTRETLDVGGPNQLAARAFDGVLEEPGQRFNPLVVHGPVGSGKTHFAHALGNALRVASPEKSVACLAADRFVEELVVAMQEGGVERWRARYQQADVFILEDIHRLVDKERSQDELFRLFNVLHDRGSQIVLTSERPTREMPGLADRLRSRFEGGLVVALTPRERPRLTQRPPHVAGELDRSFLDAEKMIWAWPDLGGRLIEEYR